MLDKYDIFYGISEQTKDKFVYWVISSIFSLLFLFWLKEKKSFFHFNLPTNTGDILSFSLSVFALGLAIYTIVLSIFFLSDVKYFKKNHKKFFIQTRILNHFQKERILKKIYIRKGLYSIVLKPNGNKRHSLSEKRWKYYVKRIGTRNEVLSKMKFLHYIEMKIKEESPLKNQEIDYLNDLMFSKEDISLFQSIQKDVGN